MRPRAKQSVTEHLKLCERLLSGDLTPEYRVVIEGVLRNIKIQMARKNKHKTLHGESK